MKCYFTFGETGLSAALSGLMTLIPLPYLRSKVLPIYQPLWEDESLSKKFQSNTICFIVSKIQKETFWILLKVRGTEMLYLLGRWHWDQQLGYFYSGGQEFMYIGKIRNTCSVSVSSVLEESAHFDEVLKRRVIVLVRDYSNKGRLPAS